LTVKVVYDDFKRVDATSDEHELTFVTALIML